MSDEVEIIAGGAIAVGTAQLREAAARWATIESDCATLHDRLLQTARQDGLPTDGEVSLISLGAAVGDRGGEAGRMAAELRQMAELYDLVELRNAETAARARGDAAQADRLKERFAERARTRDPGTLELRLALHGLGGDRGHDEALRQLDGTAWKLAGAAPGLLGVAVGALLVPTAHLAFGLVDRAGFGSVPTDAGAPQGEAVPVRVTASRARAATAPGTLTELARRIPHAGPARIRVERYTMPDGTRRFLVYASGTRPDGGDRETFDGSSNTALYLDYASSGSYEATQQALEAAGAQPGDTVSMAGYSQGAMVVTAVALSGRYEVPMVTTFGNPVQADLGADTMNVAVRHRDDLVSALSGHGIDGEAGAPGSFVASRVADDTSQMSDLTELNAHRLDAYVHTAQLLDGSDDPRMAPVRAQLAELQQATTVDSVDYEAERYGSYQAAADAARAAADAGSGEVGR